MQPLDRCRGLVGQDLDQIRSRLVSRRLHGIIVEFGDAVRDAELDLCPGESSVDSGSGLCAVAPEEALLVEDDNVSTLEVDSVRGTQP